jgi:virulence-associated protein VagC
MAAEPTAKVFWSGGSQAVRLPKAMRLAVSEVTVRRVGTSLVLEPLVQGDDWLGFWDGLATLKRPVRRWKPRRVERRKAL